MKQHVLGALLILLAISCEKGNINDYKDNPSWQYEFTKYMVDSLSAIHCRDGYVALFGMDSISVTNDKIMSEQRVIYLLKADYDKNLADTTDAITIIADSLNFPMAIISHDFNALFSKVDNNHFDCILLNSDGGYVEEKNIECDLSNIDSEEKSQFATKAIASDGYSNFNLANALTVLSVASNLGSALKGKGAEIIAGRIGLFGDLAGKLNMSELGLAISLEFAGGLGNALLAVAGYGAGKIDKFWHDALGTVYISIDDIEQVNTNTCVVSYTVDGLNENGINNSRFFIESLRMSPLSGHVMREYITPENGSGSITISNLEPGVYGSFLCLYSSKYHIVSYMTKPTAVFSVYGLEVDSYKISSDPQYSDGSVTYDLDVYLNGDAESLNSCSEFGYYISNSNDIKYYKVSQLSATFASTPAYSTLLVDRDDFDKKNYNTFTAEATGYKIGAYVVDKRKSRISLLGEESMEGLQYIKEPSIKFTRAEITGVTSSGSDDDISYEATYSFDCDVSGTFWFDSAQYTIIGGNWTNQWESSSFNGDGSCVFYGILSYGAKSDMYHNDYFTMYLNDGTTRASSNSLLFGGSPNSPTVSIGGSTKSFNHLKAAKVDSRNQCYSFRKK